MSFERIAARRAAADLEEPVAEARNLAETLGLSPYDVNYWIVDYDEMNRLIAYGGFQHRYPHWRWGMQYDRQQKQGQYAGGKAFEIVNNDDPAHAFLQESNDLADQKAVITHVEAHSDFFANNRWFGLFGNDVGAAAMLERHGDRIGAIMQDPEVDRAAVERWIDHVLCLEDTIDQHRQFARTAASDAESPEAEELSEKLSELELSDEVREEVFDEEWLDSQADADDGPMIDDPEKDVLAFLRDYGKQYDEEAARAEEMEDWQREILELLREEAYYFAPQKMTKVMNEGWAAYWESTMMGEEAFAEADEFVDYADHQSRVLGSPGMNPYKLGKELWEYVENTTNRKEVVERLLRVDGVTWRNFHDVVDFEAVQSVLAPDPELDVVDADSLDALAERDDGTVDHAALDRALNGDVDVERYPWKVLTYEGLARRHFSLTKPQNRGFLRRIGQSELEQLSRYLFDDALYDDVESALADVEFTVGWDRMREIRESHNDVTFLDEYLTQEFVDDNHYFTYEFTRATGDYRVSSTDHEDVKKKLLLQFTNFGKPTVVVYDGNYENRNELLLGHQYNGIMLDVEQARRTLERVFELWGRPVNLMTVVKELDDQDVEIAKRRDTEPSPEETGKLLRYDGEQFEVQELDDEQFERIAATDVDYDTRPDDWLA